MGPGDFFYAFIFGAGVLLSLMGLWFAAVIPALDRWSKRFFLSYFAVFLLCCLSGVAELTFNYYSIQGAAYFSLSILECVLLALPFPMLTVYLAHCCGADVRSSGLLPAAAVLMAVYFVMLVSIPFIEGFYVLTSDGWIGRGPLYPLHLLPLVMILLLNFAVTIQCRKQLSPKVFIGFLVCLVPMTAALITQTFVDVFPFLDISYVLSALSMYSFVLSDQIEQDQRRQREIIRQQVEIANQRASITVLQMRPHFIYNTLMTIYSLCNQDPPKARQVTLDFTNYLRKNFNAVASDSAIPFSAELEHTRAYLAVEQAQYEDMLAVDYDTPFIHFRLPPLTLQPLVENAVKHGMNPYAGPLRVSVRTRQTAIGAEITVEDSGPGFASSDEGTPHPTLANIKQRLEMMCGGSMTIQPRDGGGTAVILTIPSAAVKIP